MEQHRYGRLEFSTLSAREEAQFMDAVGMELVSISQRFMTVPMPAYHSELVPVAGAAGSATSLGVLRAMLGIEDMIRQSGTLVRGLYERAQEHQHYYLFYAAGWGQLDRTYLRVSHHDTEKAAEDYEEAHRILGEAIDLFEAQPESLFDKVRFTEMKMKQAQARRMLNHLLMSNGQDPKELVAQTLEAYAQAFEDATFQSEYFVSLEFDYMAQSALPPQEFIGENPTGLSSAVMRHVAAELRKRCTQPDSKIQRESDPDLN